MNKLALLFLGLTILSGCSKEKMLISNPERLMDIERMLTIQKELTSGSKIPIWSVLEGAGSKEEEQALNFLYAYMPLSDLADYTPEFIKAGVRQSLRARKEMSWGQQIPEEEFLHFVLPMRVNNENLDSFRLVYYDEIKARVKGLTMKQAALEINHWCHEKVNYRGTDGRTSAPMSTISKTFGRCGEESTFTVTAMRTAGIPARQVYTPRWAHTDDNHAWVEVWIGDGWHFMGACEPDTDLDRGWFSEPSQRTMLVHTRTYGHYYGPEEVVNSEERFSELNLTSTYAKTKKVTVVVTKPDGSPVDGARVEFKLYNYAEFYPIATTLTNRKGSVNMTTGMGDLLVWATDGDKFAYKMLHVPATDTLKLVLEKNQESALTEYYDLVPPKALKAVTNPEEQEQKINDQRLAREDSIRNRRLASFKDTAWIHDFAQNHNLGQDSLTKIIRLSYGNWNEIANYLEKNGKVARKLLLPLLYGISDKDLSDTKEYILTEHLLQTVATAKDAEIASPEFRKYVLAPRINLEILSSWRKFLWENFNSAFKDSTLNDVNFLVNWIKNNIRVDLSANKHSRAPLTPAGVFNLKVADPLSRDIFFVAACRSFNIPARLNPETFYPEYLSKGTWYRAGFDAAGSQPELGKVSLRDKNSGISPQYSLHFTIARIVNGKCQTLEFDEGRKLSDFPDPLLLECGNYMLVTGKRLSEGSVLSAVSFFEVSKDKPVVVPVELRKEETDLKPLGVLECSKIILKEHGSEKGTTLSSGLQQEGSVVVLLDPDSEPSKHILNDLAAYADQFNNWKGNFLFVIISGKASGNLSFKNYKLPQKSRSLIDSENALRQAMNQLTGKEPGNDLPAVAFCLPSGAVMMTSTGYKIGLGEQLVQLIEKLKTSKGISPKTSCTTP